MHVTDFEFLAAAAIEPNPFFFLLLIEVRSLPNALSDRLNLFEQNLGSDRLGDITIGPQTIR
jgi:hypothetical protein